MTGSPEFDDLLFRLTKLPDEARAKIISILLLFPQVIDEQLEQCLIDRQSLGLVATDQIDAAISNTSDVQQTAVHNGHCCTRPHAAKAGQAVGDAANCVMDFEKRLSQEFAGVRCRIASNCCRSAGR